MALNSQLPAFHNPESFSMQGSDGHGLTKLEYAAIHIAAGLAAHPNSYVRDNIDIATRAVQIAHQMFYKLES